MKIRPFLNRSTEKMSSVPGRRRDSEILLHEPYSLKPPDMFNIVLKTRLFSQATHGCYCWWWSDGVQFTGEGWMNWWESIEPVQPVEGRNLALTSTRTIRGSQKVRVVKTRQTRSGSTTNSNEESEENRLIRKQILTAPSSLFCWTNKAKIVHVISFVATRW